MRKEKVLIQEEEAGTFVLVPSISRPKNCTGFSRKETREALKAYTNLCPKTKGWKHYKSSQFGCRANRVANMEVLSLLADNEAWFSHLEREFLFQNILNSYLRVAG